MSLTSADDVTSLQAQLDRKERELKAKVRYAPAPGEWCDLSFAITCLTVSALPLPHPAIWTGVVTMLASVQVHTMFYSIARVILLVTA